MAFKKIILILTLLYSPCSLGLVPFLAGALEVLAVASGTILSVEDLDDGTKLQEILSVAITAKYYNNVTPEQFCALVEAVYYNYETMDDNSKQHANAFLISEKAIACRSPF